FFEGEIIRGASGAFAPLVEEAAVAQGEKVSRFDAQKATGCVAPRFGPFEFGVNADGRLVEDAVADGIGVFGAPLFINKGGSVPKLREDVANRLSVLDRSFRLLAMLVAC